MSSYIRIMILEDTSNNKLCKNELGSIAIRICKLSTTRTVKNQPSSKPSKIQCLPDIDDVNHQGLDNQLIEPRDEAGRVIGNVECHERLGGLLKYYYRDAA